MNGKMKLFGFVLLIGLIVLASAGFASASYQYTTNWFYNNQPVNGVRAINFVCLDSGCNTLGTRTFDSTSATNSITVPYTIPSPTYGYATYWFGQGYVYQKMAWTPRTNSAYTERVDFTKNANCQSNVSSVTISGAEVGESIQISAVVDSAFKKALFAPFALPSDADLVRDYFSANTKVNLVVKDSLGNIVFSDSLSENISMDDSESFDFEWTPSTIGAFSVNVSTDLAGEAKCSSYLADEAIQSVNVIDSKAPVYSQLTSNPISSVAYVPNATYQFSANWTDNVALANVVFTFNGVNYTATQNGDIYSASVSDLGAGAYSYGWSAVDSSGNTNSTGVLSFVVSQATPSLFISMDPGSYVINGTTTNVSGGGCPAQLSCTLYRDSVAVSNPDVNTFALGSYAYTFSTSGNANYTSATVSRTLTVAESGSDDDEESNDTVIISDNDLFNGVNVVLKAGDKAKFNLCGMPYYLKFIENDDDAADFKIIPGLQTFSLKEDKSKYIDLTGDGISDIYIKVVTLSATKVKVFIKKTAESVCPVFNVQSAKPDKISIGGTNKVISLEDLLYSIIIGLVAGLFILLLINIIAAFVSNGKKARRIGLRPVQQPNKL